MTGAAPRPARRITLSDPAVLRALAHPVRIDVLGFLMSAGPATASGCARAVGDTPSNCSYHLRVLARHGLVEPDSSADGRERPWRATITGFTVDVDAGDDGSAELAAAGLQLDHQIAREYLRTRDELPEAWRRLDAHAAYGLLINPDELRDLAERIDALVRPYLAPTRADPPPDAGHVHLSLLAVPRRFRA
jgi:DNA-binding transcriptional ArsR family regulator